MYVKRIEPPFDSDFDAIIPVLYTGIALSIKQTQPYSRQHVRSGYLLFSAEGQLLGRLAIYLNPALQLEEKPCLSIGAFECIDDLQAAQTLLNAALQECSKVYSGYPVIGPMDGATWHQYRFVTNGYEHGPFLLEPFALPWYPKLWEACGFKPLMRYHSNIAPLDPEWQASYASLQAGYEAKGLSFRCLNLNEPDRELQQLARFNQEAFQDAFLFSPLSEAEFIQKNKPVFNLLIPDLVQLAERNGRICGMIFAYPNRLDPSGKTAVVKTLARLPGEDLRGLGDLLCARLVDALLQNGFEQMIHALMRETNASLGNSSRFWGAPFKSYTLYIHPS